MRHLAALALVGVLLLASACSQAPVSSPPSNRASLVATIPPGLDSSGTLTCWFAGGGSRTTSGAAATDPEGTIGSFNVEPTFEDSRVPSPQQVYVTAETSSTFAADLLDPHARIDVVMQVSYHLAGSRIIADRVHGGIGAAR